MQERGIISMTTIAKKYQRQERRQNRDGTSEQ
jgi:hypothetical protein